MNIADQAIQIRDTLKLKLDQITSAVQVAYDYQQLWEAAANMVDYSRVFIVYDGEDIRGDFGVAATLGRVDRSWTVAIFRGKNMTADRGLGLTDMTPGAGGISSTPPFYDTIDFIRDSVRSLQLPECESPVDYKSIKSAQAQVGDKLLSGYFIEFTVGTQLDLLPEGTVLSS